MKKCSTCNKTKKKTEFCKDKYRPDGLYYICKECRNPKQRISNKKLYKRNKKKVLATNKKWRKKNPEKYKECSRNTRIKNSVKIKSDNKKWRKKNKKKIKRDYSRWYKKNKKKAVKYSVDRARERLKTDLQFKLSRSLRDRVNKAMKIGQKSGSAVKDLGCTVDFLKEYIEKLFKPGMTWKNRGNKKGKWELDHIIPLFSFDLSNRKQFLKANHYTNLQPIWYEAHKIKTKKDLKKFKRNIK